MSALRHTHLITPGDHFSPRTGSAVPTVVDGLCRATPAGDARPRVLVARGTYPDRYDSAEVVEYEAHPLSRVDRYVDPLLGRAGLPRRGARRSFEAALADDRPWKGTAVLAHNAPQAIPLVGASAASVLYVHNQLLSTYGHREVERTLESVDAVVCVSEFMADATSALLPVGLRPRVSVVRNGVDLDRFAGLRTDGAGTLRVTFLGRVIPDKGAHVLLDAIRTLDRADIAVTVVGRSGFAADDPLTDYESELRTTAASLRAPVVFTSFLARDEVAEVLKSTDVLVVPSVWPEPFGLTALEGMAAGTAVVASDSGGLAEAVGSGGLLVPPDDSQALAGALEALADDPAELAELQERARTRAREMSWARARADLDQVVERLC